MMIMLSPRAQFVSVGESAKRLGVPPKTISKLFYDGHLRDDLCPIVGGRRIIPEDYVEIIGMELRRRGCAQSL